MIAKLLTLTFCFLMPFASPVAARDLTLWYDRPAANAMDEALPVGNGRIGGVLFGGVAKERLQFSWQADTLNLKPS